MSIDYRRTLQGADLTLTISESDNEDNPGGSYVYVERRMANGTLYSASYECAINEGELFAAPDDIKLTKRQLEWLEGPTVARFLDEVKY